MKSSAVRAPSQEQSVHMRPMEVTPQKAEIWIKDAIPGKQLRDRLVKRYAAQMIKGQWLLNGQGIAFDQDGRLVDGLHRLHAVIMAARPVTMFVAQELPREAIKAVDRGISRTHGDILHLAYQMPDAKRKAAVARLIAEGAMHRKTEGLPNLIYQTIMLFEPGIEFALQFRAKRNNAFAKTWAFAAAAFVHRGHEEQTEKFMKQFLGLEVCPPNSAVATLKASMLNSDVAVSSVTMFLRMVTAMRADFYPKAPRFEIARGDEAAIDFFFKSYPAEHIEKIKNA